MRPAAAIVAAIFASLMLATSTADATFPGANGLISFVSDRDGDFEIYTVNPDGSGLRRLTNAPGNDGPARWSPDGKRIAFASERDGNSEIYVMNADGSGQTRLTNDPTMETGPSWSPDGTKIAFNALVDEGRRAEIFVMNADGSGRTQVTNTPPLQEGVPGGGNFHPYWGPDGRIAIAGFTTGTVFQIHLIHGDGSGRTQVTNDPVGALTPSWSPDGRRILFYSARDGQGEVYAINADGSGEARLTNASGEDAGPVYSPDGTKIAFSSQRAGPQQLFLMNPDGSGLTRLLTSSSNDVAPDWQAMPLPPPRLGETVNVAVVSGIVRVRARGARGFSVLAQARQLRVGSEVDAQRGVVRMASSAGGGRTQSGDFGRGVFQVRQAKAARAVTELRLKSGNFRACGRATGGRASASRTIRRLFSRARGRFRTRGRYSAATVRGTTWTVSDRCDGTLTSVTSGSVRVRDFKRRRTVTVRAGRSYLARARR
jgi:Tol biopolymer transport system component